MSRHLRLDSLLLGAAFFAAPMSGVRLGGWMLVDLLVALSAMTLILTRGNLHPRVSWLRRFSPYVKFGCLMLVGGSLVGAFVAPPEFMVEGLVASIKLAIAAFGTSALVVTVASQQLMLSSWYQHLYVAGAVVSVLYGAIQFVLSVPDGSARVARAVGLAHHANALGLSIALALPLALGLAFRSTRIVSRVGIGSEVVVLAAGLLLTGSRGALLGVVVGLMTVLWLRRRSLSTAITQRSALVGAAIAATVVLVVLTSPALSEALTRSPLVERFEGAGGATTSLEVRQAMVEAEFNRAVASLPLGSGFRLSNRPHNVLIEVVASAGVLGALGLILLAVGVRRLLKGGVGLESMKPYVIASLAAGVVVVAVNNALWNRGVWMLGALAILTPSSTARHLAPVEGTSRRPSRVQK